MIREDVETTSEWTDNVGLEVGLAIGGEGV